MRTLRVCFGLAAALWMVFTGPGLLAQGRAENVPAARFRFDHLTIDDGLSMGLVRAITQDHQGFIWFATGDGLTRYDGYTFTVYKPDPYDTTSLSGHGITALYADRNGTLWAGTDYFGLNRYNPEDETFARYQPRPDDPTSIVDARIMALAETRDGALWVGTQGGLSRMDPERSGRFTHFAARRADTTSLSHPAVTALAEDTNGVLWVGTRHGLNRLDPATRLFRRYLFDPTLPEGARPPRGAFINRIVDGAPAAPGVLWLATLDGLVRFDAATGTHERFRPSSTSGAEASYADAARDPDDASVLWLSVSGGGVARFDARTRQFTTYLPDPADPVSPSEGAGLGLFTDRSGTIWQGTLGTGVNVFHPSSWYFSRYGRDAPGVRQALGGSAMAWGLYVAPRAPNVLWMAHGPPEAEGAVLEALDRTTGEARRWQHVRGDPASLPAGLVCCMLEDRAGDFWVAAFGGIARLDRATGRFTPFAIDPTSTSPRTPFSLLEDRSGTLWLGTSRGLCRRDEAHPGRFTCEEASADSAFSRISLKALLEDHAGALWVGSWGGGLLRRDPATGQVTRFVYDPANRHSLNNNLVETLLERPREPGIIWAGTQGGGLNRLDTRTGTFTHYTERNSGLASNWVYGILEDAQGRLWLSTNKGLVCFDPEAGTFRTFDRQDGVQSREFNSWSYARGPTGELFFGGPLGVNAFDPADVTADRRPPEVVLTGLRLFNRTVYPGPRSALRRPLHETTELRLTHRQSVVTFEFVGLHYKNPSRNRYAYRLEGFDREWVAAGTQRTATYTNLAPGRYVFRAKAANADGVWNEAGAAVQLVILPPWWRTPWAYGAYALLLVGGIVAVDRVQRQRLIRRERERARERELAQAREIERAYAELKRTQTQLVQQEKLASLGALTAGIAHEIKNPLNFVNNFSALSRELAGELREALQSGDQDEAAAILADLEVNAAKIEEHGRRADGIVRAMLEHSRGTKGEQRSVDLNALLDEYVNLAYHGMRARKPGFNTAIERNYDETIGQVSVVPQDLGRVFLNLLNNAFQAVEAQQAALDGAYTPVVRVATRQVDGQLEVCVEDNGGGVPAALQQKIFEPFFTTKATGEGTGLGLSLSHDIVTQRHGGTMWLESEAGEGARFIVRLPISNSEELESA